ncbi:MAG: RNA polymerase sigma factor [Actinobacteria bacterium]|nr:RNA polymerase sigma factor [Actinomycetota bacterium]
MKRQKATGDRAERELVSSDLIERCKDGDEQAWKELVEATHRDVYTLCLRILGNPADAQEATQDVFLKVWRNLSSFRGEAMFSTWLYRVASNTAISKHRKRKRQRVNESGVDDEVLAQIPSPGSVESAAGAKVEVERLEEALALLPEGLREAVVLRDVYGLNIAEIAAEQKISETAAKVRVHRGRKKLKEIMFPEKPGTETEERT